MGMGFNLLAKKSIECWLLPRVAYWVLILVPFAVTHMFMLEQPVLARVVGLCVVLLLGMKAIVYMEWIRSGGCRLTWLRWFGFSYLWFGMEPRAWVGERKKMSWGTHAGWGSFCILIGAVGLSAVSYLNIYLMPLTFIFMSMMFHFGVLRWLTAFWRMNGFPVRALFRNPLVTTGFGDFWGARWNLAYSQMMARAIQRPLTPKIGKTPAIFVVFLVSGFFHECAITIPAQSGYGYPTLFFLLNGLAVIVESKGKWLRYACLITLIAGLPVLFPLVFVEEVIEPIQLLWKQWIKL